MKFKIVESSLYQNTLVSLPTGLGKTFIAAVVMYNFFRWYPSSKIVFMAPTKPLVAQQVVDFPDGTSWSLSRKKKKCDVIVWWSDDMFHYKFFSSGICHASNF